MTLSLNYVSPFLQRPIIHQMTFAMADNAVQTYKLICGLIGQSDKYLSSKEKSPVRILGKSIYKDLFIKIRTRTELVRIFMNKSLV